MRQYDIFSGSLLILCIIDFALGAPVLAREKRQACVNVVHIPKDVINVVEKRGEEELDTLLEQYFKSMGKPAESSDAHASSGSAAPGPVHGSTSVVQAPPPNPGSSTANPNPLMRPSGPSAAASMQGGPWNLDFGNPDHLNPGFLNPGYLNPKVMPVAEYLKTSKVPKLQSSWENVVPESPRWPTRPKRPKPPPKLTVGVPSRLTSTNVVQAPAPNPASLTASSNPLIGPSGQSAAAPMQGYLFSGHSSSGYLYPEYPLNPKPLNPKPSPPKPNSSPLNEFSVPIFDSSERNPPVSPVPPPSDHGSTNVVQAPVPILKSSEVYASSSSAPLRSDHGSTNVVQAPVPNPASSTANPDPYYPLMPAPMQGGDEVHGIPHALTSTEYHSDHDMGWEQALQPDKRPWTDPDFNWDYLTNPDQHLELPGLAPAKRPKYGDQVEHWQQPNLGPEPDLDWNLWSNLDDGISRKQSPPKETGQAHENEVEDVSVPKPNPRSSTERESEVMNPPSGSDPR